MSTIKANPAAPIATPTLAPVVRPLESLEAVLLARDSVAVEVVALATVGLRPGAVGVPKDPRLGEELPPAVGIGGQAVVKSCVGAGLLAQIMSNSYVLKISNVDGAVTVAEEL
jgi:hypothetical protein